MTHILERDIERKVVAYAKKRNVLCYKFTSPGNRGVPDRILIGPSGKIAFLELKRPGQKPTALQQHILDNLTARGVTAWACDWFDGAKQLIDSLCD